jgi:response regulator RpfG family c-di-GMP phosphodiesterase
MMSENDSASILVVESNVDTRGVILRHLDEAGYSYLGVETINDCLTELEARPYAIVLCNVSSPDEDEANLVGSIKQQQGDAAIIMMTTDEDLDGAVNALKAGAYDCVTKPLNPELLNLAVKRAMERRTLLMENRDFKLNLEQRIKEKTHQVSLTLHNAIEALVFALEAKDEYSEGHSRRVADQAVRLGERIELSSTELERLRLAALLEDIGYIGLKEGILTKPNRLTPEEYEHVKTHPDIATRILEPIDDLKSLIPIIRHHHERYDGKGYPDAISGDEIPLASRILALADVHDALVSPRPYRDAFRPEMALAIIEGNAGSQFDPELTASFIEMMRGQ